MKILTSLANIILVIALLLIAPSKVLAESDLEELAQADAATEVAQSEFNDSYQLFSHYVDTLDIPSSHILTLNWEATDLPRFSSLGSPKVIVYFIKDGVSFYSYEGDDNTRSIDFNLTDNPSLLEADSIRVVFGYYASSSSPEITASHFLVIGEDLDTYSENLLFHYDAAAEDTSELSEYTSFSDQKWVSIADLSLLEENLGTSISFGVASFSPATIRLKQNGYTSLVSIKNKTIRIEGQSDFDTEAVITINIPRSKTALEISGLSYLDVPIKVINRKTKDRKTMFIRLSR